MSDRATRWLDDLRELFDVDFLLADAIHYFPKDRISLAVMECLLQIQWSVLDAVSEIGKREAQVDSALADEHLANMWCGVLDAVGDCAEHLDKVGDPELEELFSLILFAGIRIGKRAALIEMAAEGTSKQQRLLNIKRAQEAAGNTPEATAERYDNYVKAYERARLRHEGLPNYSREKLYEIVANEYGKCRKTIWRAINEARKDGRLE